jgi:hypothetical protein
MGFAFLTKYSTVALIPITLMLAAAWVWAQEGLPLREVIGLEKSPEANFVFTFRSARARSMLAPFFRSLLQTCCIIAIGYLVIYPVYLHHIWNYAPANQVKMAEMFRDNYGMHGSAKDIVIWASDKSVLRPWAQYFLGLLATLKASNWGQGVFFMGKVYPTGMRIYFPFVYLVKEPLALHILTIVALLFGLSRIRRPIFSASPITRRVRAWLAAHFTEFALLLVLGIYWAALIRSNMNIGVRHLLPAFPFTFVLVAKQIVALLRRMELSPVAKWGSRLALGGLLAWQAASVLRVHPSYLAYFNEVTGGPDGGWRYVNDSNLDWGQDVKRMAQFVEQRGITGIHTEYFGPADPSYYLKERYLGSLGCSEPPRGWVAVSAMVYPGSPWAPQCDYQRWLPMEKLVATIGHSIFIFQVE